MKSHWFQYTQCILDVSCVVVVAVGVGAVNYVTYTSI